MYIGDKPRCERTDGDSRQQIADDGREAQAQCDKASNKSEGQTDSDGGNERTLVRHSLILPELQHVRAHGKG